MKNIAVYGGSFNPPHLGHINLVKQLNARLGFDEIILIPSKIPPHKPRDELISGEHRLKMCEIAAGYIGDCCHASDIELRQERVSFTVNTLLQLKKLYPGDKLWFIIGSDMLLTLDKWYKCGEILSLAAIAAAARNEGDAGRILNMAERLKENYPFCEITAVTAGILEMSSSGIREKIKNGEDVSNYLLKDVYEYIKTNGLYM